MTKKEEDESLGKEVMASSLDIFIKWLKAHHSIFSRDRLPPPREEVSKQRLPPFLMTLSRDDEFFTREVMVFSLKDLKYEYLFYPFRYPEFEVKIFSHDYRYHNKIVLLEIKGTGIVEDDFKTEDMIISCFTSFQLKMLNPISEIFVPQNKEDFEKIKAYFQEYYGETGKLYKGDGIDE